MKYGLTTSDQMSHFLFAIGFGFLAGFFYRFVSSIRKAISSKKIAYIIQDLFFSIVTTILAFVFMLVYSDGEIRFDLIIAMIIGALIYFLSCDNFVKKTAYPIVISIKKLVRLIFKPITVAISLLKKLSKKITNSAKSMKNKIKNRNKDIKKQKKEKSNRTERKKKNRTKRNKNKNCKKLNKFSQ